MEAARQAKQIEERSPLADFVLPAIPEAFAPLLAKTIDDIAQDAEAHLAAHLAMCRMEPNGGNWIANGLDYGDGETCPFCGQSIVGLPLIAAYRAVFSDRYKALRGDITAMRDQIAQQFGDGAIGRLNILVERNKGAVEFWKRYCTLGRARLDHPDGLLDAMRELGRAALVLLERKDYKPLEPVELDAVFGTATAVYEAAQIKAQEIATAIRAMNVLVAAKKKEAGAADVQAAEAELLRRRAAKVRHGDPAAGLCADHVRLTLEKNTIEQRKVETRAQLDTHARKVMAPYQRRINEYLDAFNAGFRITQTGHGYPGGTAASTYQLVINNTTIDIGDGRTPPDRPSAETHSEESVCS